MNIGAQITHSTMCSRLLALFAAMLLALSLGALVGCADNGAASSSAQDGASSQAAEQVDVSVSIDLTAADGDVETVEVSVPAGSTVLDATQATGFTMDVQDSDYGKFVNAINGVATGDHGDTSGWLVALNGEDLAVAADKQEVSAGDEIAWRYVTSFE